jgi:lysozyme
MSNMKIGEKGLKLIKRFEGLKLSAYYCPGGILTIGYGHTGKDVFQGQRITVQQAEDLLRKDVERFEKAVERLVTVELSQEQFDALVSFTYNLGEGALAKSTLLKVLNRGEYSKAAVQFDQWNKAGGKVLAGLVARREAEEQLFLGLV